MVFRSRDIAWKPASQTLKPLLHSIVDTQKLLLTPPAFPFPLPFST
jgi:hypothetical protein